MQNGWHREEKLIKLSDTNINEADERLIDDLIDDVIEPAGRLVKKMRDIRPDVKRYQFKFGSVIIRIEDNDTAYSESLALAEHERYQENL